MKIYNQGDEVWCVIYTTQQVPVQCPVCFGKKVVHLILGDGSKVEQKCAYCSPGYSEPSGTIMEHICQPLAELKEINCVQVETTAKGTNVRYVMVGGRTYSQDEVFDTAKEADAFAFEKVEKGDNENFERALRRKERERTNRTYSWGAGYHMKEAKEHRKQAEYHDRLAKVCKERKKEG